MDAVYAVPQVCASLRKRTRTRSELGEAFANGRGHPNITIRYTMLSGIHATEGTRPAGGHCSWPGDNYARQSDSRPGKWLIDERLVTVLWNRSSLQLIA